MIKKKSLARVDFDTDRSVIEKKTKKANKNGHPSMCDRKNCCLHKKIDLLTVS